MGLTSSQKPIHQVNIAEQITNSVLKVLQDLPGQTYIGKTVVKHRIVAPASPEEVRRKCWAMVAKSWNKKWV